ncbi:MAG: hypothetical protein ACYDEP_12745 [Acidimicrobiales bacterium]
MTSSTIWQTFRGERIGTRTNRRPKSAQVSLVVLIVLAVSLGGLALQACASSSLSSATRTQTSSSGVRGTSRSQAVSTTSLCKAIPSLNRLVVTRVNAFPKNAETFVFAAVSTVEDPGSVRAVARELCALPNYPPGVFHCPADLGITYRLAFFSAKYSYPQIDADIGGCEPVKGVGETRRATPSFWDTLGKAIGVPAPYERSLQGRLG